MSQQPATGPKYWLVQVPRYVYDEWMAALDNQERKEVGKMVVVANESGLTMSLHVPSYGPGAPTVIPLKSKQLLHSHLVFTEQATEADRAQGAVSKLVRDATRPRAVTPGQPVDTFRLEGAVATALDGKLPMTPEYAIFLKERAAAKAAEEEKQKPQVELNSKVANAKQVVDLADLVREQRKRQRETSQSKTEKRVRMAESAVVAKLAQLFSKKQYYTFQELSEATQQPRSYLTSILKVYCDKQVQGEYIHHYSFKDKNTIISFK